MNLMQWISFKKLALLLCLLSASITHGFTQCAVNRPISDVSVIDKSEVSFDGSIKSLFNRIKDAYDLDCVYFYYDDSKEKNAFANPGDGNIYLGVNILNECLQNGNGYTGVYYIVAHEMSHLYQFKHPDKWLNKKIDGTERYSELQADFMAGYILGKLNYINSTNYNQLLRQVWVVGDNTGGWHDPDAHGTATERISDTHLGLSHWNESCDDAFTASMQVQPPKSIPMTKTVAEIDFFNNANPLYIKYGGAVYDNDNNQVGQMSTIPNTPNFIINFTKEGFNDLTVAGYNVYNSQGQAIGTYKMFKAQSSENSETSENNNITESDNSRHFIGEKFGGGVVFYVTSGGVHGLICSTEDLGRIAWNPNSGDSHNYTPSATGATETGVGSGRANTKMIIDVLGDNDNAASKCKNYNGGGYNDWFLPSKEELNKIYINKSRLNDMVNDFVYWSSSEVEYLGTVNAWTQDFETGIQSGMVNEFKPRRIIAVRKF